MLSCRLFLVRVKPSNLVTDLNPDHSFRHWAQSDNERTETARERLKELAKRIDTMRALREERSETASAILLAFLSGTTLQPVLMSLAEDWYGGQP